MDVTQRIRDRLAALEPENIELYDDSHEHAGHAGARAGGGHYQVLIVSRQFEGQSSLARHRMIYATLADMMKREIHALAIKAYTPTELQQLFPN